MITLVLVVLFLASAPYSCSGVTSLRLHVSRSELTDCSRGDVGLTDTSIQVQYRYTGPPQGATVSEWSTLKEIDPQIGVNSTFELPPLEDFDSEGVQLRLLQLEHGGGTCNCWEVEEAVVMSDTTSSTDILDMGNICSSELQGPSLTFCSGQAQEARGFISKAGLITSGSTLEECPGNSFTLIPSLGPPLTVHNCSTTTSAPKLEVAYGLVVEPALGKCDGPEMFNRAIEFAMRTNTSGVYGPWIPLRLTQNRGSHTTPVNVRGYDVEVSLASQGTIVEQVTICGDDLLPVNASEVQFRWMNTGDNIDFWTIFNVTVDFIGGDGNEICKLFDSNIRKYDA